MTKMGIIIEKKEAFYVHGNTFARGEELLRQDA